MPIDNNPNSIVTSSYSVPNPNLNVQYTTLTPDQQKVDDAVKDLKAGNNPVTSEKAINAQKGILGKLTNLCQKIKNVFKPSVSKEVIIPTEEEPKLTEKEFIKKARAGRGNELNMIFDAINDVNQLPKNHDIKEQFKKENK